MLKTYMKYPNILNIHKLFHVFWIPDRVSDRTHTGTEIYGFPSPSFSLTGNVSSPHFFYLFSKPVRRAAAARRAEAQQQAAAAAQAQPNQPEFAGRYNILKDWRLIYGLIGPMIEQREAICWAIVLARLIEAAHNIFVVKPVSFIQISIEDLVSKIKTKEDDKEITKFEKSFQSPGIKKVPSTPHANPDKTKTVSWNFGSKEAASMNFISAQLETSPVGIIIDVDDEFRALKNGLYRIRNVVGSENRHALIVMARGRTEDGQDFLIVQNSWKKSWGVNGYGRLILADDMRCLAFYPLM
uniref:Peptidase C1A papain C-terminal domain-containing protein n=1 Tax=Brassica oleracea TaxID=3712 RepID=A0A3P6EQK0_BRAOL|nr:unnamed protein product [Brassica oleracea]